MEPKPAITNDPVSGPASPASMPMALTRYLIGESPAEESAQVEHWATADPVRRSALDVLHRWWGMRAEPVTHQQVEAALEIALRRVHLSPSRSTAVQRRRGPIVRTALYVCASAIIAIAFFLGGRHGISSLHETATTGVSISTFATTNGQRSTVTLPDGSVVNLNVASRIRIADGYGESNRIVHLDGEAFFTVKHYNGAPFTVIAGPSVTRVLGTSFVVRHYESDTIATVAVRDGKVVAGSVVLTAGQEARIGTTGLPRVLESDGRQFGFVNGVLTLSSRPLQKAIPELNRWYDADIRLGSPELETQRVAGGFKAGSLTDLSSIFELIYNVRVVRTGRILTLYPKE